VFVCDDALCWLCSEATCRYERDILFAVGVCA